MNSRDVMADLETCGTKPGCAILSIGASTFDLKDHFYERISLQSCRERGLKEDPETLAWWRRQSNEAFDEAFSGTLPLETVLGMFADWLRSIEPFDMRKVYIWGNGADFDLPILVAAYEKVGMKVPWAPFNGRCYRTLKNLYKEVLPDPLEGIKHNALADAKFQAMHAKKILTIHFSN